MKETEEYGHAKINLTLDVLRKREDGYHDLKMIMQTISLSDKVTIKSGTGEGGIEVSCSLSYLPISRRNTAYMAAREFFRSTGIKNDGISVYIQKNIPVTAGLAGGSADGAAVLRGLNRLYGAGLSTGELCRIAEKVGSDVPFCVAEGTMLAEGRGEVLTRLSPCADFKTVLCTPPFPSRTAEVFGGLKCSGIVHRPDTSGMLKAIQKANRYEICSRLYNVLERVVLSKHSSIKRIKDIMIANGCMGTCMSGSGPTVYGLFASDRAACDTYNALKNIYRNVYICNFFQP